MPDQERIDKMGAKIRSMQQNFSVPVIPLPKMEKVSIMRGPVTSATMLELLSGCPIIKLTPQMNSGTHVSEEFSITFQIWWEFYLAVICVLI